MEHAGHLELAFRVWRAGERVIQPLGDQVLELPHVTHFQVGEGLSGPCARRIMGESQRNLAAALNGHHHRVDAGVWRIQALRGALLGRERHLAYFTVHRQKLWGLSRPQHKPNYKKEGGLCHPHAGSIAHGFTRSKSRQDEAEQPYDDTQP